MQDFLADFVSIVLDILPLLVGIVITAIVAGIGIVVVRRLIDRLMRKEEVREDSRVRTTVQYLKKIFTVLIAIIAIFIILAEIVPDIGEYVSGFFIGAGFIAIVIGLAAQRTLGNFFAGLNIISGGYIRIGDAVDYNGEYGFIEEINMRHTVIRTWDNRRMIVPNSILDESVIINYTLSDSSILYPINLKFPGNVDIDTAKMICTNIGGQNESIDKEVGTIFQLTDFNENWISSRILFKIKDQSKAYDTACEIRESLKREFDAKGIPISIVSTRNLSPLGTAERSEFAKSRNEYNNL